MLLESFYQKKKILQYFEVGISLLNNCFNISFFINERFNK